MVTTERYHEVMQANSDKRWDLQLDPVSLGIVHGALRVMLMHPGIKRYSKDFKMIAGHLRNWCLTRFREMGFTEEEVQELDSNI